MGSATRAPDATSAISVTAVPVAAATSTRHQRVELSGRFVK